MALRNKKREQDKVSSVRSATQSKAQIANKSERPVSPALALKRAASTPPSALSLADVLALQRSVGNRAVGRILGRQSHELPARPSAAVTTEQRKAEEESSRAEFQIGERKENRTGLPDHLKAGIENLSGVSLDDVKVHYNSPAPAAVQALAYTQGADIHVGPGQEKHLPHEAWHVVQQKQGRVKPTLQVKGLPINDDKGLEREADVMGAQARRFNSKHGPRKTGRDRSPFEQRVSHLPAAPTYRAVQLLADDLVAHYMPPTPFANRFKASHIVTTNNDLSNNTARNRLGGKQINTIILMTEEQGKTELKGAIKNLTDDDAKEVDNSEFLWDTAAKYKSITARKRTDRLGRTRIETRGGNTKHKLGMKLEKKSNNELIGIKIMHYKKPV